VPDQVTDSQGGKTSTALFLTIAGLGCLATACQVYFIREFLAIFAGNELCLGIIFACWFTGIVIGAALGGGLAQGVGNRFRWLAAIGLLQAGLVPVLIGMLRVSRSVLDVPAGELPGLGSLLASGLVLIVPASLLVGLSFPLACRLSSGDDDPLVIGRTYVFESAGAVVGGLAVGMVLAGTITTLEALLIAALPLLGGLSWLGLNRQPRAPFLGAGTIGLSALVLICLALGVARDLDQESTKARFDSLQTGTQRVGWAETPYQHVDLGRAGKQFTLFADGKVAATFPDSFESRPRAHLVLTQHPRPRSVLLLGCASFEFLPIALLHDIERLDVVEVDRYMVDLIRPRLPADVRDALKDRRVQLHLTDGRRFLREAKWKWDVIFSDAPDPTTAALNRFYTREFFELARSRLEPDGLFATRLSSSVNYIGPQTASLIATLRRTLQEVFTNVEVLPGAETFFFASDNDDILLGDPAALGDRYQQRNPGDPRFSRHHFRVLFQAGHVDDLQEQIAARGQADLNTDARPVTYLQNILRWSHMTGEKVGGPLAWLATLPIWVWFLLLPGALVLSMALMSLGNRNPSHLQNRGAGFALLVVGAEGLALEIVLTFAYQSLFGNLYREMGLIVAAFMSGLVIGGMLINVHLKRRPCSPAWLSISLFLLALFSALLPLLLSSPIVGSLPFWLEKALLLTLVLAAGLGTGVVFPLASSIVVRAGRPVGRTAGVLDALDHLGAVLGALLAGLILVPVLGRSYTCLLLALVLVLTGAYNLAPVFLNRTR